MRIETREIADTELDNISGGIVGQLAQSGEALENALPALPGLPGLPALNPLAGGVGVQVTGPVPATANFGGGIGI